MKVNDVQRILLRCPICGRYYGEEPALSRIDNKTKICAMCGMKEAIMSWSEYQSLPKEGVGITK